MRWVFYGIGVVSLSLGIILTSKSDLGVSPIISIAYASSVSGGFDFGNASFVMYIVMAVAEYIIKGRNFKMYDLLQLPLAFLMSRLFDLFGEYLPDAALMPERILFLALGIIFTGTGAAMMLNCRLVPNPADGLVQALSDSTGKPLGLTKNFFDITCVAITAAVGYIFTGGFPGLGIGTIASMIFVGRVIALYNYMFMDRMLAVTGLANRSE